MIPRPSGKGWDGPWLCPECSSGDHSIHAGHLRCGIVLGVNRAGILAHCRCEMPPFSHPKV